MVSYVCIFYINRLLTNDTFSTLKKINEYEKKDIFISITNKEIVYRNKPDHLTLYKKYKLADARQAHADLEARKLLGPAILIP